MPQVPQSQRQVQQRTIQAQTVTTSAGLEMFGGGQGVQNMMNAAGNLAESVGKVATEYEILESDKAIAEATKRKNAILFGSKDDGTEGAGYFSESGKNATVNMDTYKEKLKKANQEIEDSLATPFQKARFKNQMSRVEVEIDGQMKRHAMAEAEKYDDTETQAIIKNHQDDAVINYKDVAVGADGKPVSKIREALSRQEEVIKSYATRKGYGPDSEFAKQKIIEAKTATHRGVIERMLANDEDLFADEYLKQAKDAGEVDGRALPDLERLVEAGTLRGESQRWTDKIIDSGAGMGAALAQARDIEDPKLRDEVTQRLKVRFSEAEQVKNDVENKNFASVADHIEQFKSRDKIPMDQWLRLSPSQRSAIDSRIAQLNSAKIQTTDQEKFYELRLMAAAPQTRDKFAKMNLFVEARKHLSDKDFNKLVELQAGIIKNDETITGALDGFRSDNQVVSDTLASVGIDKKKKPELYSQVVTKVDTLVQQWKEENGKKTIPNDELKKIIDGQVVQGTVPGTGFMGMFKTKKRVFELEQDEKLEVDMDSIPKEDVSNIKRALQKKNIPATDQNIINLYSKVRLAKR